MLLNGLNVQNETAEGKFRLRIKIETDFQNIDFVEDELGDQNPYDKNIPSASQHGVGERLGQWILSRVFQSDDQN